MNVSQKLTKYFNAEMRHLRQHMKQFAKDHPDFVADDPYVDQLLSGVALLTAQLQQRADLEMPEFADSLLACCYPELLQPHPSACILQFQARQGQMTAATTVEKGMQVCSPPVGDEKVICRFQTCTACVVNPLAIQTITTSKSAEHRPMIQIDFKATTPHATLDLRELTLFCTLDREDAEVLFTLLLTKIKQIKMIANGKELDSGTVTPLSIQPCHLRLEDCLLPLATKNFCAWQLFLEYFSFREKYYFFKVCHLEQFLDKQISTFSLQIEFTSELPESIVLEQQALALHCVPAINLFSDPLEPVQIDQCDIEYPLVLDSTVTDGLSLFALDSVESRCNGQRRRYEIFPRNLHKARTNPYVKLRRERQNEKLDRYYLQICNQGLREPEVLSCVATLSNNQYPWQCIPHNDLNIPDDHLPYWLTVRNITRPTKQLQSPVATPKFLLLAALVNNYRCFENVDEIKGLLRLLNWSQDNRNQQLINAIVKVDVKPIHRLHQGLVYSGMAFYVEFASDAPRGLPFYSFGLILYQVLRLYVGMNQICELVVHDLRSEVKWRNNPFISSTFSKQR